MGVGNTYVDNACSGGITVGVHPDGKLNCFARNNLGDKFECHPTSHVEFDSIVLPSIDRIDAIIKKVT